MLLSFKDRIGYYSAGPGIFLVFLILYALTASPSIGWRDAPEFSVTTNSLGVAHPAGFPTYSLITKVFTYLPFGSIPFRATLAVAFFAAASLWVLYSLVYRWTWLDDSTNDAASYRAWAAVGTAVAFGFTQTLWVNTTENEVYTLNLLLIGLILYCTLRWSSGDGEAWLFYGALIYGLAAGNHGSIAFYAPGFFAFFLIRAGSDRLRKIVLVLFFFMVGFSVYLYLPIRSAAAPPIDFGNPETWQRFLMHVTDRKDSTYHFVSVRESGRFAADALNFARFAIPWWFWPFVLPLAVIGIWRTAKEDKTLAGLLVYIGFFNVLFFLNWTYTHSNFLPVYFITAYLAGIGMAWFLWYTRFLLEHPRSRTSILSIVVAGMFTVGALLGYRINNRSNNYLSYEIFRTSFETLPPDSITLVTALWPYYVAYQSVFRMRDDLTIILQSDFIQPENFKPLTPERFPRINIPLVKDKHGNDRVRFQDFLDGNFEAGFDIFWEFSRHDVEIFRNLMPGPDFLMQIKEERFNVLSTEMVQGIFDQVKEGLQAIIDNQQLFQEPWIGPYYYRYLFYLAKHLQQHGRYSDAISVYQSIVELLGPEGVDSIRSDDLAIVYNELATALFDLERIDEAVGRIRQALEIDPNNFTFLYNMGLFLFNKGEMEKAEGYLQRSLTLKESDLTLFIMANVKLSLGQLDEATRYYQKAHKITDRKGLREEIESKLDELRKEEPK